ncbi:conopressin/neurophysin-like [Argonauta hians]
MSQGFLATVPMLFVLYTVFGLLIITTNACYFRNCPLGGKRSTPMTENIDSQKCMSCGPNGEGQCVGPNICCHKDGCIIGALAKECAQENESTTPCAVKGIACGTDGQGRCVADGVCCDDSSCVTISKCIKYNLRGLAIQQRSLQFQDGIYYKQ